LICPLHTEEAGEKTRKKIGGTMEEEARVTREEINATGK
jgi:hypothetical protein